jgi:hypothetical protein
VSAASVFLVGIDMTMKAKKILAGGPTKDQLNQIQDLLKSGSHKALLRVRHNPSTDEGVVDIVVLGTTMLYVLCQKCFGTRTGSDDRHCPYCNGCGFEPINSVDAAILVDKVSNTLEPLLKKRAPTAVDVLADAHHKLVDMILDHQ